MPQGDPYPFAYGAFTLYGAPFQGTSARVGFCNSPRGRRTPPGTSRYPTRAKAAAMAPVWFRLCPFRSPLLRASRLISFPRPTKMFCFGRFPLRPHDRAGWWASTAHRVSPFGHPGLTGSCASARLFAALHALRRLREPRHPSRALTNLHTGGRGDTGHILLTSSLLMEVVGLEPTTSCLQSRRSPS